MHQAILDYCKKNSSKLNQMTTPQVSKHLKEKFPSVPVAEIRVALGVWAKKNRPGIAC